MADSSSRQTTRTPPYLSRSRRHHSEPLVARRTGSSHRASPYQNPADTGNVSAIDRQREIALQWSWLPTAVAAWRVEENIEIPPDTGRYTVMDLSPYTQEPTHLTVPVLAARVHRHERRLHDVEVEQLETNSNWINLAQGRLGQIYQDQEDLTEAMDVTRDRMEETRGEVAALRLRLAQYEQRLTLAEENARQASSLAETVERLITLLPQLNLHRD